MLVVLPHLPISNQGIRSGNATMRAASLSSNIQKKHSSRQELARHFHSRSLQFVCIINSQLPSIRAILEYPPSRLPFIQASLCTWYFQFLSAYKLRIDMNMTFHLGRPLTVQPACVEAEVLFYQ